MGIVYDKFRGAWLDRDAETYMSCLHTEYEFHLRNSNRCPWNIAYSYSLEKTLIRIGSTLNGKKSQSASFAP